MPIGLAYQLYERQLVASDIVHVYLDRDAECESPTGDGKHDPLRMMVSATAETGKDWPVNTLSHLLGPRIRRAAPTGMAVFLIDGSTLHRLCKRPIRGGRPLQGKSLHKLHMSLRDVEYLVIDELSIASQIQFAWGPQTVPDIRQNGRTIRGLVSHHDRISRADSSRW